MKNCIFIVFIVSISSNIIGSDKQISPNKKRATVSDSCLLIPKGNFKKKSFLKSVSTITPRKKILDIKKRLGAFENHLDLHTSNNIDEFNKNLREKKRCSIELKAIAECPICFKIIQKNFTGPKESCNQNNK